MGIPARNISSNLNEDQKLWRYMSLDKLIDILHKKRLYFSAVGNYTFDPHEGLLPKTLRQEFARLFEKNLTSPNENIDFEKMISLLLSAFTVNCWHQNDGESEAMWKLYSDLNKGVAIQTTVKSLSNSITSELSDKILFSDVHYVDLHNNANINLGFTSFKLIPVFKRLAFQHEREARLIYSHPIEKGMEKFHNKSPATIEINPLLLIEKIYISPYAEEPFPSSVECILKMFGISDEKIVRSDLLTVDESLKKLF